MRRAAASTFWDPGRGRPTLRFRLRRWMDRDKDQDWGGVLMAELRARYVFLTGAYCAFIFYLSSISEPPDPGFSFPYMDKVVHVLLYGGLAATLSVGIRRSNEVVSLRVQLWAPIVFAVLYGVTDEVHQIYVSNRGWELLDLVADGVGAVLAQTVLLGGFWRERATG